MEGMLHGDNFMACAAVLSIGIFFGGLDCALNGFRAAVGKKYPVHAGYLAELSGSFYGWLVIIEV